MEYTEEIARKLRETVREFGQDKVTGAVIIGSGEAWTYIGGHKYIYAPTVPNTTLAYVDFKVARFFEDA